MAQSIFSNTLIATAGRSVTLVCGLAATALMARMMSVEGFGVYSLILTIATMVQLGADFGLYLTLSHELGISGGKPNEKIANIISFRLILLLLLFGVALLVFLFLPSIHMAWPLFVVFALGLIFQSGSQLLMSVFQAHGSIWRATVGDIIGRLGQLGILAAGFFFFPERATSLWIATGFTIGLAISFIIHVFFIPENRLLRVRLSLKTCREILQTSWPIALMLILNVIYFRIDTVILSSLRSSQEVGLYSLAYKIIENGLFFPAMIGGLLLPAISSALSRKQIREAQDLINQGLTLSFSGACMMVALLMIFSNEIIDFLAGPPFFYSGALLRILAIALGSMCIGNIFGFSLIALGKQRMLAILYGILMVVNILANLILIPVFGAMGAAWVTVATEIFATVTAGILVYRQIPWALPIQSSVWIIFGTLASVWAVAVLLGEVSFLFRFCASLLLYIGIMYVGGVWSRIKI